MTQSNEAMECVIECTRLVIDSKKETLLISNIVATCQNDMKYWLFFIMSDNV